MSKYLNFILNILTLGKEGQSFLGARWVECLLKYGPKKYKKQLALTVLSWSPHYFYRGINPDYRSLTHSEFTAREFERNKTAREKICVYVLSPHVNSTQVILDYGCGPGFLANSVSKHVHKVYGIDLSKGVLECARILNGAPNITFLNTTQLSEIDDGSVDLVYSFAVIQHVTDSTFGEILTAMHNKLRHGGQLVVHIVLDGDNWRDEQNWRRDKSTAGRLKLKYGLNCFKRNEESVGKMVESAGYKSMVIQPMAELCPENFDDVCTQHLIRAVK